MITEAVLKKWMEENTARPFPLDDSVNRDTTIPYPIIIGLTLQIPSSMLDDPSASTPAIANNYKVYVGSVEIVPRGITVTIMVGDEREEVARAFATFAEMEAHDGQYPKKYSIFPLEVNNPDLQGVSGDIYFGPLGILNSLHGLYELDVDSGLIDVSCIVPYPDHLRGLSINGKVLTGDITFVAGENIELSLEEGEIVISYIQPDKEGILSREALLDALVQRYGHPILTINGIQPDSEGNITIAPSTDGEDDNSCVDITDLDHGIALSNVCATPCCDRDEYMDKIARSIGELNTRAARLSSYLESVTSNINSLQNELSILKLGINQE